MLFMNKTRAYRKKSFVGFSVKMNKTRVGRKNG